MRTPPLLLLLALSAGCALLPDRNAERPPVRPLAHPGLFAEVVKVADDGTHVILDVVYPPGREAGARVFRSGRVVGRIALLPEARRHYRAAKVLEGAPQVGDFVRP